MPEDVSPSDDIDLLAALDDIRRRGGIGESSLEAAIAHADRFVAALPPHVADAGQRCRLVDLGSGGGLPALVIAVRRPDLLVTMVERRASRADLLRRAVSALGLVGHADVVGADVRTVVRDRGRSFDVVTARSFAAPDVTAAFAASLLVDGGLLVVSEPPDASDVDRWTAVVTTTPLQPVRLVDGVRVLRRI